MNTNFKGYILVLSTFLLISASKGQTSENIFYPDTVSITYLCITNDRISPLLDSVCYYWENSPLGDVLSYATVVPCIRYKSFQCGDTVWHVRLEQLYDFDVFGFLFPGTTLSYLNLFVTCGFLYHSDRPIFIGAKKVNGEGDVNSMRIVESYFHPASDEATFIRNTVKREIDKTNFIRQTNRIESTYPFPEALVYDSFDSIELYFIETDNTFSLFKIEVDKNTWK